MNSIKLFCQLLRKEKKITTLNFLFEKKQQQANRIDLVYIVVVWLLFSSATSATTQKQINATAIEYYFSRPCIHQQPWNSVVNTFKISSWFPLGFWNEFQTKKQKQQICCTRNDYNLCMITIKWNGLEIHTGWSNKANPKRRNCTPAPRFHVEMQSLSIAVEFLLFM